MSFPAIGLLPDQDNYKVVVKESGFLDASTFNGQIPLRYFKVENDYGGLTYIERIGRTVDPFFVDYSFLPLVGGSTLSCYKDEAVAFPARSFPECGVTKTENINISDQVILYPTITFDKVFFDISGSFQPVKYTVYSLSGQQLLADHVMMQESGISLRFLTKGMYIIFLYDANGHAVVNKIVKI